MSSPAKKRDIVRLRTFADDVAKVKEAEGITDPIEAEAIPNEAPEESRGFFKKLKKKPLKLKDDTNAPSPLDEAGVAFDKKDARKVTDQAYEENRSVSEGQLVDEYFKIKTDDVLEPETPKATAQSSAAGSTTATPPHPIPQDTKIGVQGKIDTSPESSSITPQSKESNASTEIPKPSATGELKIDSTAAIKQIRELAAKERGDQEPVADVSNESIDSGDIVTDKKRERFKLMPAIGSAVTGWLKETKEHIDEARREKHTVGDTHDRAETIKAAVQPKTLAQTEGDHAEVADRLKQVKRETPKNSSVIVVPKKEVKPASWSHTTGETPSTETIATEEAVVPAAPLAEPATQAPRAETTVPTTISGAPAVPEVPAPEPEPEPEPEPVDATTYVSEPAATPTITPAYTSEPVVAPMATKEMVTEEAAGASTFALARPRAGRREYLPSPVFAIVIVIIAIISGVATSIYFFWQPEETVVIPEATATPLFIAELQTEIPFTQSHSETMSTLLSAVNSNPVTIFMYLVHAGTDDLVQPTEVMSFLAPQAPGSFTRSVTNLSFGAQNQRPFIILKVNNFDNAFAGMLAWEQTMSADLAPLFGPIVTESYDPLARTDTQTRSAFFKDVVVNNLSARLLVDAEGEDRIIYTFIDRQTILITTDRLQLTNITPLVR